MQKLYKILWSLAILSIIVIAVILSLGFILVAATVVSLYGIYRYYLRKRSPRVFKTRPYTYVEEAEVIHETLEVGKPDAYKEKVYWITRSNK